MARTKLSKAAANSAITYSHDASERLLHNVNVLDKNVNAQFSGLSDPTYNRYLELSDQMQTMLKQVGDRMEAVATYCRSVIKWIDLYNQI